ncbi:TRAP transporter small permease [Hwanghaeella grinnelliae]|uniref:TRAP transporter small permease protein n=1 Tax=Hwanghaeella grinnelliae TaxID=2500179 RepID=A0A3S2WRV5_9PROT|nr:TRAP transporter small permease [Hwanghaeella grinnelliae]RVU36414.1 TRAP transporter small permease [Hwanghaeella grinnelliae]
MQIFSKLVRGLAWMAAFLFVAAGVMLTYEVVARYFFTKPTIWAAELSQLCLIWGSLVAMAWALGERRHIAVDAVVSHLSPAVRRWTDAVAMLVIAWLSAMVVWKGGDIFLDSFERGRTTGSMLDLPSWVAELAVPFGFAVLFVQAVVEALRAAAGHNTVPDDIGEGGHFE